ncbi:restriction endonuclease [Geomonas oryzisoli]|uniref:Restriction endonuclease n=1 Tax=Geomonas oryzisoli TaxID=2847992 RepID=A0ABX8JCD0_9BACT|nr:restriction endonuclease [Geomonas oryzisoli]QWV93195.1 restriction endonuclease [Geomonas oryzisoli]
MARRPRTSPIEDVIIIASKFPWWVSVVLAIVTFLMSRSIPSQAPGNLVAPIVAMFCQMFLAPAFLIAAGISGYNSLKQRKLNETVKSRTDVASLNEMTWGEFETLVAEHFKRNGFEVAREGGSGPDGGIDLVLRKGREKHLVQCKQWKAYKVSVQPVREFYGVMAAAGAAAGYFVTTGDFTQDDENVTEGLSLELKALCSLNRKSCCIVGVGNFAWNRLNVYYSA